jgi:uncharacterized membrane protein
MGILVKFKITTIASKIIPGQLEAILRTGLIPMLFSLYFVVMSFMILEAAPSSFY